MQTSLSWFRGRPATETTPQEIEQRLGELTDKGFEPATFNRYRALLNLLYSVAVRNGKISGNPARLVRP